MYKTVKIGQLKPNPFRNMDDYPIDKDRVDLLRQNYRSTGFWGNLVARENGSGVEISYGHHRLEALIKEYGKNKKVGVIVRKLSNEDMIRMMAQENLDEWATSAFVEAETVQAVIDAYGCGEIKLPAPGKDTNRTLIRYAVLTTKQRPYTVNTIARFLGWTVQGEGEQVANHACRVAFAVLDALDQKVITRAQIRGLKRELANVIVSQAMRIKKRKTQLAAARRKEAENKKREAEQEEDARKKATLKKQAEIKEKDAELAEKEAETAPKKFTKTQSTKVKSGNSSVRGVRNDGADELLDTRSGKSKDVASAEDHLEKYGKAIDKMLRGEKHDSMVEMLEYEKFGLTHEHAAWLEKKVNDLIKRAKEFGRELSRWQ